MLKRPKVKNLSSAELQSVLDASAQQTGKIKRIRTYDPNFPVFEIPVNQKVLAYVPNHTIQNADGSFSLLMDKFAGHDCVLNKREYLRIRCTSGLESESLGLDGSCPFCSAVSEVWDLANKEFSAIARSKGLDPEDENTRVSLKSDWEAVKGNMAVRGGVVYVTFPIVVVECEVKDGKTTSTPKKDANGYINAQPMWYTCSEKVYKDKWLKALETAPTDDDVPPDSPAGLWVILNYEYDDPSGKHNKMISAQKLAVGYKSMSQAYDAWATKFDEITEAWTPAKAVEVLVDNSLRDMEEQTSACDEIMRSTRDKLRMFEIGASASVTPTEGAIADGESALSSFGATEVTGNAIADNSSAGLPNVPQVGISTGV